MPFEKGTFIVRNDDNPDYVKSCDARFRFRWPVAGDYEIKNGILSPRQGSGWRDSYPAISPNIPLELAKIKEGDERALLAFTRKHGMFGAINLLPGITASLDVRRLLTEKDILPRTPGMTEEEHRHHSRRLMKEEKEYHDRCCNWFGITDQKMRAAWLSTGGGDPLPWVWAHIRTLKICLELTYLVKTRCQEETERYLRRFQTTASHIPPSQLCPVLNFAMLEKKIDGSMWPKPDDKRAEVEQWSNLDFAKHIRRRLVNGNIAGIRIALEPTGASEDSFFEYRSLIEMAYWHVHNIIIEGRLRRCLECRTFFVQRDKREKFCRTKLIKGQSYCGIKYRARIAMRKLRRDRKQKGKR